MEPINLQRKKVADSSQKVKWSQYNVEVEPSEKTEDKYLLYNTATGKLVTSKTSFTSLIKWYEESPVLREGDQALLQMGFLVPFELNELALTRHRLAEKSSSRNQSLIILPTEQCNFRCVYCYEEFLKGKMTEDLQNSLVEWVETNAHRWDSLSIGWFGGEPLVAYDVIKHLSKRIVSICNEKNIRYSANMTTNAYMLTLDKVKELYEMGVTRYQITLDGPEEYHNQKRVLYGGQGTFQRIMDNLLAIRDSEYKVFVTIRTNFDTANGPMIPYLLDQLSEKFGSDSRFSFRLHPVGKWGGENDENLPICTSKEAQKTILDNSYYGMSKGLQSSNAKSFILPESICYASMPNHLVIGSDGTIYKCTVAFDLPSNKVGQLLPNGTIEIDRFKFSQWVANDGAADKVCVSCKIHPICHGASCPLMRIENGLRPCPPYKSNMSDYISVYYQEVKA
ncbi:radical SAM/SPASM domain-containing protein [Brevibacillus parabrevis]|uniref:radical SAM/SPASM domain-containing protein n=1 Tax=Brevibacillus parabrevis TaxID=54914 RepID=UPI002E232E72|nr:radical SAM protein [Brevibacillus parabrevis]